MPGQVGRASAVGIECGKSEALKGAERFQLRQETAGLGKAAPGLELEASLQVTTAAGVTPYLSAIRVSP